MKKFKKISIVFLVILFLIIIYLIITTEELDDTKLVVLETDQVSNVDNSELGLDANFNQDDYISEVSKYYNEYLELNKNDNMSEDDLLNVEKKLLSLRVPTEHKDLHINFILAISKMRQYLRDGDEQKKQEGNNIIREIRLNNNWID